MSIFDRFRPDPTRDWPEGGPVALVYDLARRELNGIPAGAPIDRLRTLGRPANDRPVRKGLFCYPRLGIEVHVEADRVSSVSCVFQPVPGDTDVADDPGFRPCEIELRLLGGERVRITAATGREEIGRHLGPLVPVQDASGGSMGVHVDGVWIGCEFDSANRLYILDIEPESVGS